MFNGLQLGIKEMYPKSSDIAVLYDSSPKAYSNRALELTKHLNECSKATWIDYSNFLRMMRSKMFERLVKNIEHTVKSEKLVAKVTTMEYGSKTEHYCLDNSIDELKELCVTGDVKVYDVDGLLVIQSKFEDIVITYEFKRLTDNGKRYCDLCSERNKKAHRGYTKKSEITIVNYESIAKDVWDCTEYSNLIWLRDKYIIDGYEFITLN